MEELAVAKLAGKITELAHFSVYDFSSGLLTSGCVFETKLTFYEQVGWDESAGEKRSRVSIWEIEPVTAPFFIYPTTPFFCSKRPRQPGMPGKGSVTTAENEHFLTSYVCSYD